ncbi:MAG: hypothetical protein ABIJ61_01800, partial [bacterium]
FVLKERHCRENPQNPSKHNLRISRSLEQVIMTAIEKKPHKRYNTAEAMRNALQQAAIESATETKLVVSGKWRSKVALWGMIAVIVVAGAWFGYQYRSWLSSLFSGPPELQIASQSIKEGETFAPIPLDSLIARDPSLAVAGWSFHGLKDLTAVVREGAIRVAPPDSDWFGSENITFVAERREGGRDSTAALFTVRNVNDPPRLVGAVEQRIKSGESFAPLHLGDLVDDPDDPDSAISWSWGNPRHLTVARQGRDQLLVAPSPGWSGKEQLVLIATDKAGGSDTLLAEFEIQPPDSAISAEVKYEVKLLVEPPGGIIRDQLGNRYEGSLRQHLVDGSYIFTVYHRDYPLHEVKVKVNSAAVDTTIDLTKLYAGETTGLLLVNLLTGSNEALGRPFSINTFTTSYRSGDHKVRPDLWPGKYRVGIKLETGERLDSVNIEIEGQAKERLSVPQLEVETEILPGKQTWVDFYVTQPDQR